MFAGLDLAKKIYFIDKKNNKFITVTYAEAIATLQRQMGEGDLDEIERKVLNELSDVVKLLANGVDLEGALKNASNYQIFYNWAASHAFADNVRKNMETPENDIISDIRYSSYKDDSTEDLRYCLFRLLLRSLGNHFTRNVFSRVIPKVSEEADPSLASERLPKKNMPKFVSHVPCFSVNGLDISEVFDVMLSIDPAGDFMKDYGRLRGIDQLGSQFISLGISARSTDPNHLAEGLSEMLKLARRYLAGEVLETGLEGVSSMLSKVYIALSDGGFFSAIHVYAGWQEFGPRFNQQNEEPIVGDAREVALWFISAYILPIYNQYKTIVLSTADKDKFSDDSLILDLIRVNDINSDEMPFCDAAKNLPFWPLLVVDDTKINPVEILGEEIVKETVPRLDQEQGEEAVGGAGTAANDDPPVMVELAKGVLVAIDPSTFEASAAALTGRRGPGILGGSNEELSDWVNVGDDDVQHFNPMQ